MIPELAHAKAQMLMARPWDAAEAESIWEISGNYPNDHGFFQECLAIALPHAVTGGDVLFKMVGAMDDLISPAWVTHARLLILVLAEDPASTYYLRDQEYLTGSEGK